MGIRNAEAITVVIPSAGAVPEGVLALSNISCTAMIPVAGRPVAYWTLSYLNSLGLTRFVIGVPRRGLFVEDFVECAFGNKLQATFVAPSRDGGVGFTVAQLAEHVETPSFLVVLGDTHFQFSDPSILEKPCSAVLVGRVNDSHRWCMAEIDEAGYLTQLHDKPQVFMTPGHALVGVYFFHDTARAIKAVDAAIALNGSKGTTEMSAILRHLGQHERLKAEEAGQWLDCGNPDEQARAHKALLQKRAFNELTIDPVLGTITKRSRHVSKFVDEINYLRILPQELGVLFPRVIDYSIDWQDPFVKMEYYGYPTLAEVFVFENANPDTWARVFEHLRRIVAEGFMRYRRPMQLHHLKSMYLEKTRERLAVVRGPDQLRAFIDHPGKISINGRLVDNLCLSWERIERVIAQMLDGTPETVIHGDLCLSNVLYDLRSQICKLLDPRGKFGEVGVFGDPRYDIAKLYHSVHGLYDFITNDLFDLRIEGFEITFAVRRRPLHDEIQRRFDAVFFSSFRRPHIELIAAMLFASMPALHYDNPARQLAMYATALDLVDRALNSCERNCL